VIVFFARGFLSDWISDVGVRLDGFERLYIVVSEEEAKKVGENDPDGKIFNLSHTKYSGLKLEYSSELLGFNRDRFLRFEIQSSIGPCIEVAREIISNYDVFLYVLSYDRYHHRLFDGMKFFCKGCNKNGDSTRSLLCPSVSKF
jgi:hypothetical protein